jgi:hypothetical protein
MPEMRRVFSSQIEQIGYDPTRQELVVQWKARKLEPQGQTSVYGNVNPDKARQIMNAESVGKALHEMVKSQPQQHPHRYSNG